MTTNLLPGAFRDLAGVIVSEFDSLNHNRSIAIEGDFGSGYASVWCDVLELVQASSLAYYKSHYYKDTPAITVNKYGKGQVYYVGCDLNDSAMDTFLAHIAATLSLTPSHTEKIPGLEAIHKEKAGMHYLYLLNHNNFPIMVTLQHEYTDLISNLSVTKSLEISPYGVAVLLES